MLTLHLSAAALTLDGLTVECHSVLPWAAPAEVRRRARMLGDEATLLPAAALPAPRRVPKVEAPARVKPPALRNNAEKGVYGEHISDAYLRAQGHTKLNDGGVLTPLPPIPARGTGLDGVWKHGNPPPDYIITEAKYGSSQLGTTKDGKQMSDKWVRGSNRLERATSPREAIKIRAAMRNDRVEKRLHIITAQGTLIETIIL